MEYLLLIVIAGTSYYNFSEAEYYLNKTVRSYVRQLIPCYLKCYLQTFSCGSGVAEKECNDSTTYSMKYSSFWLLKRFWEGFFWSGLFYEKKKKN